MRLTVYPQVGTIAVDDISFFNGNCTSKYHFPVCAFLTFFDFFQRFPLKRLPSLGSVHLIVTFVATETSRVKDR